MPTLQEDMDDDLETVFKDTTEFSTTATYVTAAGSSSSITVLRIEQVFAITDNKANALFFVAATDVAAPEKCDRITLDGLTWQVVDVQSVDGLFELRCQRMQDVQ